MNKKGTSNWRAFAWSACGGDCVGKREKEREENDSNAVKKETLQLNHLQNISKMRIKMPAVRIAQGRPRGMFLVSVNP